MRLLGISSYPDRWKRPLWFASLLPLVIAIEGVGALVWLMRHSSEAGSRFIGPYSLELWGLFFLALVLILTVLSLPWAIKFKHIWVEKVLAKFEQKKSTDKLLVVAILLSIISIGMFLWLTHIESFQPYLAKAMPLLLWGLVGMLQGWALIVVLQRQKISFALEHYFPIDREKQAYSIKEIDRYFLLALLGLSLIYMIIQIRAYLIVHEAVLIGDSWSYLYGASLKLNNPAFFSERRPWAILLFYRLLKSSQPAIDVFQLSISTFAWLFLAWKFINFIKNQWIKLIGFVAILGFSLTPTVQVWNHAVLSESLSISVMILILALFVGLAQNWKWSSLFFIILFFVLWMSFREANAYVAVIVAVALTIMGFLRRTLRIYWLLSLFICVAFLINYQLSSEYALPRWGLPLAEVITKRILPNQEYLNFFASNSMPVSSQLMYFSGRRANSDNYAIINSVALRSFSKWLFTDGKTVYVKFLLAHPFYTIEAPLEDIKVLLAGNYFGGIPIHRYTPALPKIVNEIFYPEQWFWSFLWLSLFASGFIFSESLNTKKKIYQVIFIFLLLCIPHLYLVWHGDALDVARHAVAANVQFHLGMLLLVTIWLDGIATRPMFTSSSGS